MEIFHSTHNRPTTAARRELFLVSMIVLLIPLRAFSNDSPEMESATEPPAQAIDETPHPAVAEMPAGQSGIVVHGVVTLPDRGLALISANGKPQDMFSLGSEVLPGARLIAVLPDRIILDRAGRREAYRLEGAGRYEQATSLHDAPAAATTHPDMTEISAARTAHTLTQFTLSRAAISRNVNTPQQLLSQAVIVPTPNGILLNEIEPNSLIHDWGLRAGDLLVSLNGQILRNPDDLRRSYEQIRQARLVRLEIERSGRHESLMYHLQ